MPISRDEFNRGRPVSEPGYVAFEKRVRMAVQVKFGRSFLPRETRVLEDIKGADCVSEDGEYIGDAKYYSFESDGARSLALIGEVYLLLHTNAKHVFLVFGNDRAGAEAWVEKYDSVLERVAIYFLTDTDELVTLRPEVH